MVAYRNSTTTGPTRGRRTSGPAAAALAAALVTALAGPAGAAGAATVQVTARNAGFTPASVTVPYGGKVTWSFAQGTHSVTDPSRLGLFASGPRPQGSSFAFTFVEAGSYPYRSTVGTPITGTVVVPMTAHPATGSRTTPFAVQWASGFTPDGYYEDVQIRTPGKGWTSFALAVAKDATMRPVDWGGRAGVYQFRARPQKGVAAGASSGWSPAVSVTVR